MKTTITTIILGASMMLAWDVAAQSGDKKEKQLKEKQRQEQSRSLGGQRTDNEYKDDRREVPDRVAEERQSVGDTSTNVPLRSRGEGEVVPRNEDQPKSTTAVNTPAVIQRTSSESGSPAVTSSDDSRDGTNNMQRAKPNIAGAKEPGDMGLDRKNSGVRNRKGNENVRQQEEMPQMDVSKREQQQDQETVRKQQQQDQQSGEDVLQNDGDRSSDKDKRKQRRKDRRKKDKDSGK